MGDVLVLTGATGGIGRALYKKTVANHIFEQYFLYCRNPQKLTYLSEINSFDNSICQLIYKDAYTETYAIKYDMQKDFGECILPGNTIAKESIVKLVLTAHTIIPIQRINRMSTKELIQNIETNVLGQISLIQQYVSYCTKNSCELKIVFLNSGAAYRPLNGWSLYCSSKAYLDMFLHCIKKETGYDVVLYDPGVVDTGMQEEIRNTDHEIFDMVDEFKGYKEKGILHKPEDVAEDICEYYLKDWKQKELKEHFHK